MKQGLKRLTPNAFRRIDDYLLRNYPTVWYAKGHWVFYALILSIILFIVGYFMPNTLTQPLVNPIAPIEITQESYFLISFAFAVIAVFCWGFTQYQHKFDEITPLKILVILLIYGIGLFVILGLNTTTFRLGTIVRTAQLMDKEDLELVESKDYFLYGFTLNDSIKTGEEISFFEKDSTFKYFWKRENSVLLNRYDISGLSSLLDLDGVIFFSSIYEESYNKSNLSHLINRINFSDSSYELYRLNLLELNWSRWNSHDVFVFPDIEYLDPITISLDTSSTTGIQLRLYWFSKSLDELIESNFFNSKLLTSYDYYYIGKDSVDKNRIRLKYDLADYDTFHIDKFVKEKIDRIHLQLDSLMISGNDFNKADALKEKLDTVKAKIPKLTAFLPVWFYQLENGVRSTNNAKQYLKQKIIYRYFKTVLSYLPFIILLFFVLPFLSERTLIGVLLLTLIFVFLGDFQYGETVQTNAHTVYVGDPPPPPKISSEKDMPYGLHKEKFLPYCIMGLSVLGFLLIIFLTGFKKYRKGTTSFALHFLFVTAIIAVILPLFIENEDIRVERLIYGFKPYFSEDFLYYPKTWVFYLTAAMCLIAPVLFSYLKGLPKSR